MPVTVEKLLEDSIEIAAPPAKVWALVSDLPRMARWSPQVVKSVVKGGEVREGATFFNLNKQGLKRWPTNGKVVRFVPEKEIAFRIRENGTTWSFTLEPTATGGTRLTERRDASNGISQVSFQLTRFVLGGQEKFTAELRAGIRQTLERIKAEAES